MFTLIQRLFHRRCRLLTTLRGHSGPVVTLAISPNGKFLASGSAEGIKVWNLKTGKEVSVGQQPFYERSQVSSVCWVTQRNEVTDTVCYGNGLGCLVFLQYHANEDRFETVLSTRLARGAEITCIAVDTSAEITRIAVGTRDTCVQVWTFESSKRSLQTVYSKVDKSAREIVPKALAFDTNSDRDLYIFGLYDGGLYKNSGKDGKNIEKFQLGSQIGNAAVDVDRKLCVVDNLENGFDLYRMDSGVFIKTFVTKDVVKTHPKSVAFADKSHLVIGGSDHGRVYIFERKTGQVLKSLKHVRNGGVEILAVHDLENGGVIIATASATSLSRPGSILLWQWKSMDKQEIAGDRWSVSDIIDILFKLVVLLAAGAYFAQQGMQMLGGIAGTMEVGSVKRVVRNMGDMGGMGNVVDGVKKVVRNAQDGREVIQMDAMDTVDSKSASDAVEDSVKRVVRNAHDGREVIQWTQ